MENKKKRLKGNLAPYLFIAPHLVFFTVFLIIPTFLGLYISFFKWDFFTDMKFVGLKNYLDLCSPGTIDFQEFWSTLFNTFKFVVFSVPFLIAIPLFLSVLLNHKLPGRNVFRAVFYAPSVLSVATMGLIWKWLLDSNAGLINFYLEKLGLGKVAWLTTENWAWVALVMMTAWWILGGNMILFLAGLQDIPESLYEAAAIDGAGTWAKFKHITIPGLSRTFLYVSVMTVVGQFNVFGQPFMTTGGGPGGKTKVLMMYIRDVAFGQYRVGSAAAMSIMLGIILITLSIIQFKLMKQKTT